MFHRRDATEAGQAVTRATAPNGLATRSGNSVIDILTCAGLWKVPRAAVAAGTASVSSCRPTNVRLLILKLDGSLPNITRPCRAVL